MDSVTVLTFNGTAAEPVNLLALLLGIESEPRYDGSPYEIWCREWAREVFRVLRPGAHLLAFGGTRTYHRLVCAIEDAGFEVRDQLAWHHGSGFPKSLDIAKALDKAAGVEREVVGSKMMDTGMRGGNFHAGRDVKKVESPVTAATSVEAKVWDGWGTALKPAFEPIVLARKPLSESTVAANVLKWGTGALNIDASRIGYASKEEFEKLAENRKAGRTIRAGAVAEGYGMKPEGLAATKQSPFGRWPANLLLSHDERCVLRGTKKVKSDGHYPDAAQDDTDRKKNTYALGFSSGRANADTQIREEEVEDWECVPNVCPVWILDEQSGTRRSAGLYPSSSRGTGNGITYLPLKSQGPLYDDIGGASRFFYCAKPSQEERGAFNKHPTVKPVDLLQYLIRLVTPPGGRVLDPFAGSGTTCLAAMRLNMESVGVDLSEEYVGWARRRCAGALDAFDAADPAPVNGERA